MSDPVSDVVGGASAIGGIAGAFKSGGSSATNAPWSAQQPYLTQGFGDAQNLLSQQGYNPVSQFYAPSNTMENAAIGQEYNSAGNMQAAYNPIANESANLAYGANSFENNALGTASNGLGALSTTGINGQLQGGINSAAEQSLGSLGTGASLAGAAGMTGMNTAGNMATINNEATSYANNPSLQASINAQQAQIKDSLTSSTLPGIQMGATQSGNANSSREGALEGQAVKGAELADANISSSMENNAYNTGAGLASSQIQSGENAANSAASVLNQNGSIGGSLGMSNMNLGLAQGVDNANVRLAGNSQLATGMGLGQSAANEYTTGSMGLYADQYGAGQQAQQQAQIGDNNSVAMAQQPWNQLDNYWNIVGTNKGSSSTQTPNNGGLSGAISGAAGLGTAAYGAYENGMFGSGSMSSPGAKQLQSIGFYNPIS